MEQLIHDIYEIVQDYRAGESLPNAGMTPERISRWIGQFDDEKRVVILEEMKNIFSKRYCSRGNAKRFLQTTINKLSEKFGFSEHQDFLRNVIFLDLQKDEKSQKIMLAMLNELLAESYNITLAECGSVSKRYAIYLDDVLCTGNTLFKDISRWLDDAFTSEKTNKEALTANEITLVMVFIFAYPHSTFAKRMYSEHHLSNSLFVHMHTAVILKERIMPVRDGQPDAVEVYRSKVLADVNEILAQNPTYRPRAEEFYRNDRIIEEGLFTNEDNRRLIESTFLTEGINILNRTSHITVTNMRALGFSLLTYKDFGFGALCFTWRNVPNNSPLVFWHSGGGFSPLFDKHN